MHPYSIIGLFEIGYVLLTRSGEVTPSLDALRQPQNETITVNYPPCFQREYREANWVCLTCVRVWNPFEYWPAESHLFLCAASGYYQKQKWMMTMLSRLMFTRMCAILTMMTKMKTKTKTIHPNQRARTIGAQTTSRLWSPKTIQTRYLNRTGCYRNSYSNNKPIGKAWEPECLPNWSADKSSTDQCILEMGPKLSRWLTLDGSVVAWK